MSAKASDLAQFAGRYGNKVLQAQVELKAPLWKELEHLPMEGEIGVVNPIQAGQSTASFIADLGTRPAGNSRKPVRGTIEPIYVNAPLKLAHGALIQNKGTAESANYLDGELKSAGSTLAHLIDSSLFAPAGLLATITSVTENFGSGTAGVATVVVDTKAGLEPGVSVTLLDGYGTKAFVVRVGRITASSTNGSATVTLHNDVDFVTSTEATQNSDANIDSGLVANATLYQRGMLTNEAVNAAPAASGLGPMSLDTLSGSGSVYGISAADQNSVGFHGQTFSSVGDPNQLKIAIRLQQAAQISKDKPDLFICNPMTATAMGVTAVADAVGAPISGGGIGRKVLGSDMDILGDAAWGIPKIAGAKVLQDSNLRADSAFAINRDFVKIAKWHDIEAEEDDGGKMHTSQSFLGKVIFFGAMYNLYCNKRNSVVKLGGLTTDFLG